MQEPCSWLGYWPRIIKILINIMIDLTLSPSTQNCPSKAGPSPYLYSIFLPSLYLILILILVLHWNHKIYIWFNSLIYLQWIETQEINSDSVVMKYVVNLYSSNKSKKIIQTTPGSCLIISCWIQQPHLKLYLLLNIQKFAPNMTNSTQPVYLLLESMFEGYKDL